MSAANNFESESHRQTHKPGWAFRAENPHVLTNSSSPSSAPEKFYRNVARGVMTARVKPARRRNRMSVLLYSAEGVR